MNYKRTTLPNGVCLLTTPMPAMRSASIALFFAAGSRYEQDELAGVSHFVEHMLFKGSQRYPNAKLISDTIEGVGGAFNGSTGKEMTSYMARVPGEYVSVVMNVLADMVRYPLFDPVEIEKERGVIIEELSASQDDPQECVSLLIEEVMWPDHPLGRDDAGSIESVSQLQRQQMIDYHHAHYQPNSLVISIAGKVEHEQIFQIVHDLFHDWEAGPTQSWQGDLPKPDPAPVHILERETGQSNLCLATPGLGYTSPDYYTFLLINSLLGDGMSSRLFQSIREEQGLAYDIESYINSYRETGELIVCAGVDPSRTKDTVSAIVRELTNLCHTPVPDDELARIKAYIRGGVVLGLEGTQQVASWLGSQECLYERIRSVDEVIDHIDRVTAQDIQRVAQACFVPQWRRLAIVGPEDSQHAQTFGDLLINA